MRVHPVGVVVWGLGLWAALALPLVNVAPNRLVSGEGVGLWAVLHAAWAPPWLTLWLCLGFGLVVLLAGVRFEGCRELGQGLGSGATRVLLRLAAVARPIVLMMALLAALLALAGQHAAFVAQTQSPWARTSLGSGFWVLMLALWLTVVDTLNRLNLKAVWQALVWAMVVAAVLVVPMSGWADQLSLLRELANRSDTFAAAVLRHLQLVAFTLVPTLSLGLPLGWALHHARGGQAWLMPVLNVIQTIPSIALYGLLMVPLAWLASTWPVLAAWGISGIGLAPAVVALTLYSLLPVVRSTLAGLGQVPSEVREAAQAMGMAPWQVFWHAELPLAAPLILAGVRTATVQTVGLAAVAALIGAGGLGTIMFDGLFGSAQDVVLLGVLPIMGLALVIDLLFKGLANGLAMRQTTGTVGAAA